MPASQIDRNVFYYYVRWGSGPQVPGVTLASDNDAVIITSARQTPILSASISISLYLYGISLWKLDLTVRKLLCVHPTLDQHQTDN